ncbi:MAG: ATP-binding protein [Bacteroidia bacterium]|nr:ATP-binding protein [Bacteroidia bacterium]
MSVDKFKTLSELELFKPIPDFILSVIADELIEQRYEQGTTIFSKGETGECMYIVVDGRLKVHDNGFVVAELGPGEVVGEFSLLDDFPRSLSVTAVTDCILLRLDQSTFYSIIARRFEFAHGLVKLLVRRLREQNERLREEYEKREVALTIKVEQTNEELMAIMSHKDAMVKTVSHDLKSPLASIGATVGLIRDALKEGRMADVERYLGMIEKSVSVGVRLIEDILNLSKLNSGTILLNKKEFKLKQLIDNVVTLIEGLAMEKNIEIRTETPEKITVVGDQVKLAQSLNNILSNAVKFTPPNGTVVCRSDDDGFLGKPSVVIEIRDTGVGIPKDKIDMIFTEFSSLQRMGTRGEKGTGLGMSIAKKIVELHGGKIVVESEEGKGTTFSIYLPKE